MAFTIQSFVADPTLVTGDVRLPAFVADATLTPNLRASSPVLDPTALSSARLPSFAAPGVQALLAITASGTASQSTYSSAVLQALVASGTGTQIPAGRSTATLQALTASGTAQSNALPSLQLIVANGVAVSGQVGASTPVVLPYITASGTINSSYSSTATLQSIVASGVAISGSRGTSAASRQLLQASGFGGAVASGTSQVSLPFLLASGSGFLGTGANFAAVVLQTQIQALCTYSNFAFNSLARFNGVNLAASDSGLFKLTGSDDAGTPIQASARFGITDFNSAYLKRVERAYIGYRSTVDMVLRVRTNEVDVRDYRIPGNGATGMHGTHVKLGRGLEARYWQFEIRNQAGGDFTLNMVEVKPTKLERRVGRSDA